MEANDGGLGTRPMTAYSDADGNVEQTNTYH